MTRLLTPRQLQLVAKVIEEFIETAEPVSSKTIAASGTFEVRSATIRNEMCDLEDMGYLEQLHTSGGRIPTASAYRLYVNNLLASEGVVIRTAHRLRIDQALADSDTRDPEELNKVLARMVGQLSGALVMANVSKSPDSFKIGLSQLMSAPEFREYDRILGLTEFFDQFDQMVEHLHRDMWDRGDTHDVKIFIGTENDDERIKDETMIVSRYRLPRGAEGTLTLVGPMRMDYRKNIGLMMYVAQVANQLSRTS